MNILSLKYFDRNGNPADEKYYINVKPNSSLNFDKYSLSARTKFTYNDSNNLEEVILYYDFEMNGLTFSEDEIFYIEKNSYNMSGNLEKSVKYGNGSWRYDNYELLRQTKEIESHITNITTYTYSNDNAIAKSYEEDNNSDGIINENDTPHEYTFYIHENEEKEDIFTYNSQKLIIKEEYVGKETGTVYITYTSTHTYY